MTNSALTDAIERLLMDARAAAWESGYYAGFNHGRDWERHTPDWDISEPKRPTNPYVIVRQRDE